LGDRYSSGIAAVKQNKLIDRVLQVLSYTGQGFPSFITALLLLILAQNTSPLFPVGGMTSINHAELSPGQIPGYWLAHDSTDSGSQHYQLCWVTAESQEANY